MPDPPKAQPKVMISSTARDLPLHRQKVMEACMRLSMFYPRLMEHLTATNAPALEVSLKMVDEADIYVGLFAFRYGAVPKGQKISIAEAEYNRAVELDIPRLIFLMSDEHLIKPADVETGAGANKLQKLKRRLQKERVVSSFESPDDLKAQVIQALVPYYVADLRTIHYVSEVVAPQIECGAALKGCVGDGAYLKTPHWWALCAGQGSGYDAPPSPSLRERDG